MKRLLVVLVIAALLLLGAVLITTSQNSGSVEMRSTNGVWVAPISDTDPITWEVPNQIILIDDNGHTLAGTVYRAELDGVVYLACALGRNGAGMMRLEVRQDMIAPCP